MSTDLTGAPWRLWAWPYGAVVLVLLVLWMLLPVGWLWLALALAAGVVIGRMTWDRFAPDARGRGGVR